MREEKRELDVRDLRPSKDAKGGGKHRRLRGQGHGGPEDEGSGPQTAGRGRTPLP
jgi:hypothetical protein